MSLVAYVLGVDNEEEFTSIARLEYSILAKRDWLLDSGTSTQFTNDMNNLKDLLVPEKKQFLDSDTNDVDEKPSYLASRMSLEPAVLPIYYAYISSSLFRTHSYIYIC